MVTLGSGGPGALGRAGSSHVILIDGVPRILVDAGPGAFVRLGELGLSLAHLDVVLLTHLHADHVSDLPGLIKARAVSMHAPIGFRVFGPEGSGKQGQITYFPSTRRFMDMMFGSKGAFAYLPDFAGRITFQTTDLPARPSAGDAPHVIFEDHGLKISAIAGHHGDAPAVAYRIDDAGKQIVFSGDMDEKGLANLRKIAQGSSLLVFNAVVLDPPESPPVLYGYHSSPSDVGRVAADAKVSALLLAHLSPQTDHRRPDVMNSIRNFYQGPTIFAEDKLTSRP